jgi:hypothetical protein
MTLWTKTTASVCATLALAWVAAAEPALARWTFHNDAVGEEITAPPGGTRAQTCAGRLRGVGGYGHYIDVSNGEDPAAFPIPSAALQAVRYEVWKAPRGFDSFNSALEDEAGRPYFEDPDGTRHPATLAGRATTARRVALPTPLPSHGNRHVSGNFVFASAPISIRLRGVAPGDALGLIPAQQSGSIVVNVRAMSCRLPLLTGKVDVRPGSRRNTVHPNNAAELVPVRIFGSQRLHVRRIAEVHLGEAAPASVSPALRPSLRPRDTNGDGRLDRLYYFRQGDTDMMCMDTGVKVTGRTSDHKRFQGHNPIATAGCAG